MFTWLESWNYYTNVTLMGFYNLQWQKSKDWWCWRYANPSVNREAHRGHCVFVAVAFRTVWRDRITVNHISIVNASVPDRFPGVGKIINIRRPTKKGSRSIRIQVVWASAKIAQNIYHNSSPPNATYMHQWNGWAIVQIMACRLFGAKPLPEPCWLIVNWNLRNKFQWNSNQNTKLFIHENAHECVVCQIGSHFVQGGMITCFAADVFKCIDCNPYPLFQLTQSRYDNIRNGNVFWWNIFVIITLFHWCDISCMSKYENLHRYCDFVFGRSSGTVLSTSNNVLYEISLTFGDFESPYWPRDVIQNGRRDLTKSGGT